MKVISHTDEAAKTIVKKFCEQVHRLKIARHLFKELFENEYLSALMNSTAPSVFNCFGDILHRYLLLEFAKISDPAETFHKENFSVSNLIESIDWPPNIQCALNELGTEAKSFSKRIKHVRNKLLAHSDKDIVAADKPIGGFPEGEDRAFLLALQKICDIAHEACFGQIYGEMITVMAGDEVNLKRTLECALAFDDLLSKSSGQEHKAFIFHLDTILHRFGKA